jgi:2-phospho-L-lactate guanylyltransferase
VTATAGAASRSKRSTSRSHYGNDPMPTLAILPVKSFKDAKQRLESGLDAPSRRMLAESMFTDVLVALRRARSLDAILVVTTDRAAQRIAGAYGARLLDDDDRGHNYAAARGVSRALGERFDRVLLVPGDCPVLDPVQIDELLTRTVRSPSALIVSDRHGTGTNALLLTPPDAIEPSFGPGSRERHVEIARSAGIDHEVVRVPTLELDVDTPDDLDQLRSYLIESHGGAAHTRGLLRRLTA